jgi:hypothetical protein
VHQCGLHGVVLTMPHYSRRCVLRISSSELVTDAQGLSHRKATAVPSEYAGQHSAAMTDSRLDSDHVTPP